MVITRPSRGYFGGMVARIYLPIIRIVNEPGTAAPRAPRPPLGGGGGAGPRSSLIVKMWFVLLSNAIVRAPFIVCRFCSTSKVVGLFSLTTVSVPLPCVLKASIVAVLNTAPSELPNGRTPQKARDFLHPRQARYTRPYRPTGNARSPSLSSHRQP